MKGYKIEKMSKYWAVIKPDGTSYEVRKSPNSCTCKAFSFRGGRCKHLDMVLANNKTASSSGKKKIDRLHALKVAKAFEKKIGKFCQRFFVGGSIVRKKEIVGDIDIAVMAKDLGKLKAAMAKAGRLKVQGDRITTIIFQDIQINIFVCPKLDSWGAHVLYCTGSGQFNMRMRSRAKAMGYKLSQYGLFERKSGKQVAKSEKSIFKELGMEYLKPEEREIGAKKKSMKKVKSKTIKTQSSSDGYLINRFPICALWYYRVAKYLGYSEKQSKSMGLARAKFFASRKIKGSGYGGSGKAKSGSSGDIRHQPNIDCPLFAGNEVYLDMDDGLAVFGGQKLTSEDFDKQVKVKMEDRKEGYFKAASKFMDILIKEHSKDEMNSKIAYKLYEKIRDDMRSEKVVFERKSA